jgi:hypothetical protein
VWKAVSTRVRAAPLACLVALACSCGGYSEEDARTFCDQERAALAMCFTDEVYDTCLHCYQECGVDCDRAASCPERYSCEEE